MPVSSIELRPITGDDLVEVHALHQRSDAHDGVPAVLSFEELEEDLVDGPVDMATDARVAFVVAPDGDRTLAGYANTIHLPSEVRLERCYISGQVHPEFRRRGVGRALMEWAVERATEQLLSSGRDLPRYVRVDHYDFQIGKQRLFEDLGFEPVRYFAELLRPLDNLPPLNEPAGIQIVPWPDGRSDEILQAKNKAFADHWGSTPQTVEGWKHMIEGSMSRLDVSFVAVDQDGGQIVGHCFNTRYDQDDELVGRKDGWITNIGTLPQFRGRGVASALIVRSLHAFAEQGWTHAALHVDGDSPTGAFRLYRSLGFEPWTRSVTHEIQV